MNRSILALGLYLLLVPAWAQQSAHGKGSCIQSAQMSPWIQVDDQTALVNVGRKSYLVTVPDCSSFFAGRVSEVVGSNGGRICEGAEIRYYDSVSLQYIESCFIQDIVRFQINPNTNAVEINEFDD